MDKEKIKKHWVFYKSAIKDTNLIFATCLLVNFEIWDRYHNNSNSFITIVSRFLKKKLLFIVEHYQNHIPEVCNDGNNKIWVCWWQGYDNMPDFCKFCFLQLKANSPENCEVILITEDNFLQYVRIPDVILKKKQKGIIPIQQFTDILRQGLLAQQGGLWMDATIFTISGYYDSITIENDYWSANLGRIVKPFQIGQVISGCKWSSFIQYGKKGNIVNSFVFDAMCKYYELYDFTIDYFTQQHIIRIGYENIPAVKQIIDSIPVSNTHLYDLFLVINEPFEQVKWDEMTADTKIFKLSYKYKLGGNDTTTFYDYILSFSK